MARGKDTPHSRAGAALQPEVGRLRVDAGLSGLEAKTRTGGQVRQPRNREIARNPEL